MRRGKMRILQPDTPRAHFECVWMKNNRMAWNSPYKHHVQNAMRSTTTGRKTNFSLARRLQKSADQVKKSCWIGNAKLPASADYGVHETLWIPTGQNIYIWCDKCAHSARVQGRVKNLAFSSNAFPLNDLKIFIILRRGVENAHTRAARGASLQLTCIPCLFCSRDN